MGEISINQLANEIAKQVQQYTSDVKKDVQKLQKDIGNEAVQELREKSPKKTGKYAKGWATKTQGRDVIVHNKTDYQLTHLLEFGHAKADGGRVPAHPHIRTVKEQVVKKYVDSVEKVIKK